jgi:hypothetical protein
VVETPTGFSVQYGTDSDSGLVEGMHLTHDDILAGTRRSRLQPLLRRPISSSRARRGRQTYENLLRALGYELEEAGAYGVLLDELDEGWLVTYQFLSPEHGFALHKHRVVVREEETSQIVQIAMARRGHMRQRQ